MLKSLRPLAPYLWKYRWPLLAGGAFVLANNGIAVLFPQVVRWAVDALALGITRHQLLRFAELMVLIMLGKGIFQYLTRKILIGISRDIEYDLRNDLFRHLEGLSYS